MAIQLVRLCVPMVLQKKIQKAQTKKSQQKSIQNTLCTLMRFFVLLIVLSVAPLCSGMRVAVTGTTGLLGRQVVAHLSKNNVKVNALLRHPIDDSVTPSIDKDAKSSQVALYLSNLPGVTMVSGDATDLASCKQLVDNCDAIISAHGPVKPPPIQSLFRLLPESDPKHSRTVNYVAVQNLIDAMKESKTCQRIVRVTGKGEEPTSFFTVLINMLGNMAKAWNYEGEQLLRTSDVDYTIIRPGVMGRNDIPTNKVRALADNGQDLKVTAVTHSQIAELCCDCLGYDNAAKSTLTAMNVDEGSGEDSYAPLLEKVKPDSRKFPSTLLEEHKRGARNGAAILAAFVTVFASLSFAVLKTLGGVVWGIFH